VPLSAAGAVVVAAGLDRVAGEPPGRLHPVALFGRAVAVLDRDWDRFRGVAAGVAGAVLLPVLAAGAAAGLVAAAGVAGRAVGLGPGLAAVAAGCVLFVSASLRMLLGVAREVTALTETDPARARDRLRALAGRDAAGLSPADVRSAAVESAAENLADGLIAPLFGFAVVAAAAGVLDVAGGAGGAGTVGGWPPLALGAAAAAWVKAVNTMDSMLGYPDRPVGRAAARLDDRVMWLPARLSAALLAVAAGRPSALAAGRRWARRPASPNSGWPMATAAALLGIRLEKPGAYVLNPRADPPTPADARRGIGTVARAGWLGVGLAGVTAAV